MRTQRTARPAHDSRADRYWREKVGPAAPLADLLVIALVLAGFALM